MEKQKTTNTLWEKILANSFWPLYATNVYYFNNIERAQQVTEAARRITEQYKELFDDIEKI